MTENAILSRSIEVGHLPPEGVDVEVSASPEQRTAIAAAYDLVDVKSVSATVQLRPEPRGGIVAGGRVVADIVQTCVVSLVPVEQHIDEVFTVRFVPAESAAALRANRQDEGDEADPPDMLTGTTVDVGALAEEHFVLAIDPYPRAPGAELPADMKPAQEAVDSPFAKLGELVGRRPKG
jgi:uncharacterized metal-binding protein YceD (DUF177 family)